MVDIISDIRARHAQRVADGLARRTDSAAHDVTKLLQAYDAQIVELERMQTRERMFVACLNKLMDYLAEMDRPDMSDLMTTELHWILKDAMTDEVCSLMQEMRKKNNERLV
jgi:hypothetical protein